MVVLFTASHMRKFDKYFDFFQQYALKNIFTIPPNLQMVYIIKNHY